MEQAAALLIQTRSQLFPQVGYSASAARQRGSEVDLAPIAQRLITNPQNSYQVLASASWEIDLWGRIRRQTEAARANVLATEQARRGLILSLVGAGGKRVFAAAQSGCAARDREQDPRGLWTDTQSVRAQIQVRAVVANECRAGALALRDRRHADPANRNRHRTDRECAVHSARPQSRPDRPRQIDTDARAAGSSRRHSVRIAGAPAGHRTGRAKSDRCQRSDRRGEGVVLSEYLAHRCARDIEQRFEQSVHRPVAPVELWRIDRRTDLPGRSHQSAGGSDRGFPQGGAARATRRRFRMRSPMSTMR